MLKKEKRGETEGHLYTKKERGSQSLSTSSTGWKKTKMDTTEVLKKTCRVPERGNGSKEVVLCSGQSTFDSNGISP